MKTRKGTSPLLKNRTRLLPTLATILILGSGLSACSDSGGDDQTRTAATAEGESSAKGSNTPTPEEDQRTEGSAPETADATATSGEDEAGGENRENREPGESKGNDIPSPDDGGLSLGGPDEAAPTGTEIVDLSADPFFDITPDTSITIEVSGLNPERGYHVAICEAGQPAENSHPTCTGDADYQGHRAWLRNPGGSHEISPAGTATLTLAAAATGEGLDCTAEECVIKVFGDESEDYRNVADLPVTFAAP